MRRLLSAAILVVVIVVAGLPGPQPVAADPTIGLHLLGTSCGGVREDEAVRLAGGLPVKAVIEHWACDDPATVRRMIAAGTRQVVLRTGDGMDGYDWRRIADLVETPRGSGDSWGALMRDHPEVDWWLEVGNEPNYAVPDPWVARWWAIATVRELRDNAAGHLAEPWAVRYPMLRYAASLNVAGAGGYDPAGYTAVLLQWLPGDDLGAGGVLDWFDAVALHLYGRSGDLRPAGQTHVEVERAVLANPYHDLLLYSEVGQWDGTQADKAQTYQATAWPPETVGVFAFLLGRGTIWPQFELHDPGAISQLH